MHWAIYYNMTDYTVIKYDPARGTFCRSRALYLRGTNGSYYSQIFRLATGSKGVITVFPASSHCP